LLPISVGGHIAQGSDYDEGDKQNDLSGARNNGRGGDPFIWPLTKGAALDKMLRSMDTDAKAIGVLHSTGMDALSAQPLYRQIEFVYDSLILGRIEDIKTGK
jgi:hypothetical protein